MNYNIAHKFLKIDIFLVFGGLLPLNIPVFLYVLLSLRKTLHARHWSIP